MLACARSHVGKKDKRHPSQGKALTHTTLRAFLVGKWHSQFYRQWKKEHPETKNSITWLYQETRKKWFRQRTLAQLQLIREFDSKTPKPKDLAIAQKESAGGDQADLISVTPVESDLAVIQERLESHTPGLVRKFGLCMAHALLAQAHKTAVHLMRQGLLTIVCRRQAVEPDIVLLLVATKFSSKDLYLRDLQAAVSVCGTAIANTEKKKALCAILQQADSLGILDSGFGQ